jgi:phosphopantothenoylcysteine decarboxylase/phosphopantothenate--cysteine ligase
MNVEMWAHPATQENVRRLRDRGVRFVDPEEGYLACKTVGAGRLAEPASIVNRAMELLGAASQPSGAATAASDLLGEKVVVTAGPTFEAIDPVRGLTNRSSGKMGYAVAQAAAERGADVTLISGPVSLAPPAGVRTIGVRSAAEMYEKVMEQLPSATIVVMAAAVADYRPARRNPQKVKKDGNALTLELEPTEDILTAAGQHKNGKVIVGFAAETEDVLANARKKLVAKNADLMIANDVLAEGAGFDVETNRITIVGPDREDELPLMSKRDAALRIIDAVLDLKRGRSRAAFMNREQS